MTWSRCASCGGIGNVHVLGAIDEDGRAHTSAFLCLDDRDRLRREWRARGWTNIRVAETTVRRG